MDEYPSLIFQYQHDFQTLVRAEEFSTNSKYTQDLKEFLHPLLQQKEAAKVKNFGK